MNLLPNSNHNAIFATRKTIKKTETQYDKETENPEEKRNGV
jgi:hypothetical protein